MAEEPRPSYVRFEIRSVEDRNATIEQGHYVGRDVVFALITPAGTRDCVEKVAEEWLKGVKEGVDQERIPHSWLVEYTKAFEYFKETREVPEMGTPVGNLPSISPSHAKICLDINVRTIEQLAEANEETVSRIGMGGRALKERARAWLDSADQGKTAAELEALRSEIKTLRERDEAREKELAKLKSKKEEA